MSPTPEELERLAALCGELGTEDGIDPRLDRRGSSRKRKDKKAFQLCRQVDETISLVLAGADDDVLRELHVAAVRPAPNATHLRVTVTTHPPLGGMEPIDRETATAALSRASGIIRHEVTNAITRRRAPELSYEFVPPQWESPPDPDSTEREERDE